MFWSILAGCTLFVQALNIFSSLVNSRLADAEDGISHLRIKCGLVEDYERKIQNLRDELYLTSVSKPRPLPPLLDTRYVAVVHYAEWFGSFSVPLHQCHLPYPPTPISVLLFLSLVPSLLFCLFVMQWLCCFQSLSFLCPAYVVSFLCLYVLLFGSAVSEICSSCNLL